MDESRKLADGWFGVAKIPQDDFFRSISSFSLTYYVLTHENLNLRIDRPNGQITDPTRYRPKPSGYGHYS